MCRQHRRTPSHLRNLYPMAMSPMLAMHVSMSTTNGIAYGHRLNGVMEASMEKNGATCIDDFDEGFMK